MLHIAVFNNWMSRLIVIIKRKFAREDYISTGMLQRNLQISYFVARYVLDRLIESEFCEPQVGAWPCKIIKYTN